MISKDERKINEILTRGVEEVFVSGHLEAALRSGKELVIKFGIDPTAPTIHLGRAVPLRKLKALQDLGHRAVLIIGDFTARIGDPSDKLEKRPMLSTGEVKKNMASYKNALGRILDLKKTKFVYNSKWLSKLRFDEIAELSESFSVSQMSSRRNFKERLDKGDEVSLREFLYPLMQGYDSVMVKADIEVGGFDQLFNLKAGRIVQRHYKIKEQDILTTQMLEGTDGRKMSASWGNVINITDSAQDMFGKVMSLKDSLMEKYFLLCTDMPEVEIKKKLALSPKDAKQALAREIVRLYHGDKGAVLAEEYFIKTFQKKEIPDNAPEVSVKKGTPLVDILLAEKLILSKSEFHRLLKGKAIEVNGKVIDGAHVVEQSATVRVGKHRILKIITK